MTTGDSVNDISRIRKRLQEVAMKKGPKQICHYIQGKCKLKVEPLAAILKFMRTGFDSSLTDLDKSLHYLFYSKVTLSWYLP